MSGVFSFLQRAAKIKVHELLEKKQLPTHTATPLGICQGAAVKLDQAYRLFLMSVGQIPLMPKVEENQGVIAVGVLNIYGRVDPNRPLSAQSSVKLYRSYLADERSFIQSMPKGSDMNSTAQLQLFTMLREDTLSTAEETDQLIGNDGFIGLSQIDFDTPQGTSARFDRVWDAGSSRVQPHFATETITTLDGAQTRMVYQTMMYARTLSIGDKDSMQEFMYLNRYVNMGSDLTTEILDVDLAQVLDCYFVQSTGINLDKNSLKVYSP